MRNYETQEWCLALAKTESRTETREAPHQYTLKLIRLHSRWLMEEEEDGGVGGEYIPLGTGFFSIPAPHSSVSDIGSSCTLVQPRRLAAPGEVMRLFSRE